MGREGVSPPSCAPLRRRWPGRASALDGIDGARETRREPRGGKRAARRRPSGRDDYPCKSQLRHRPRLAVRQGYISSILTVLYFRSGTCGRFPLQFGLIVINSGTDEIFEGTLINRIALEQIDRSPHLASKAGVEELIRIREARAVG